MDEYKNILQKILCLQYDMKSIESINGITIGDYGMSKSHIIIRLNDGIEHFEEILGQKCEDLEFNSNYGKSRERKLVVGNVSIYQYNIIPEEGEQRETA